MTTQRARVEQLVREANRYPKRDRAHDVLVPADEAPEWFTGVCHHAHADMMPDTWRCEFIQDALRALADGADEDRLDLDALYPYTSDRLDWPASHLDRPGYCDEAAAEAGGPPGEILAFAAWGMDRELREVFDLVCSKLAEIAED
jgi:hypothetical protein